MTALTWTRTKVDATYQTGGGVPRTVQHTAYLTRIGDLDVRIESVDDLFFIKTRRGDAPYAHPNGTPSYQHTLRDAKIAVQRVADRKGA